MRRVAWHSSFKRAFKRAVRANPRLFDRILDAVDALARDPFDPVLRCHKLRGRLEGLWAAWIEYDCRLVFAFEPDPGGQNDMIVLIDIGTHDEVY